ncbi:hypothetical protein M569_15930 [Genlisea aurea]|uniref:Uncharacterized protein n=1 Tax=Genlisea aurea TaxID=192259 RepID=S8BX28_9LAMI|nr:hypothetical protein M569_15930 [Genlisea aurea]
MLLLLNCGVSKFDLLFGMNDVAYSHWMTAGKKGRGVSDSEPFAVFGDRSSWCVGGGISVECESVADAELMIGVLAGERRRRNVCGGVS